MRVTERGVSGSAARFYPSLLARPGKTQSAKSQLLKKGHRDGVGLNKKRLVGFTLLGERGGGQRQSKHLGVRKSISSHRR